MARDDGVEFTDNSVQVKADLEKAILAFLHEASAEIKTQAERYTPVGESSQLKKSWDTVIDKSKKQAMVGNPLEYAIYQEFGTGEYALEGNGRKGYWVYVKDSGSGSMAKSSRPYTLEEAKSIVAGMRAEGLEAVYTKGTRPKRMLYKAFTMCKPKIQLRFKQVMKSKGF